MSCEPLCKSARVGVPNADAAVLPASGNRIAVGRESDALEWQTVRERVLNQTGTLQAGSLWFDVGNARLRLTQTPVGQTPGVNYFSVVVSATDLGAAAEAVFAAGGIIETILPDGFSFWDPDGHRVLIRTAALF